MGLEPIDLKRVSTYPISERRSLVDASILKPVSPPPEGFQGAASLIDDAPAAEGIDRLATAICAAHDAGRPVALGMGAHAIKLGLGPYIADLVERRVITAVAMNGATAFHDLELSVYGVTSEDVASALPAGRFGFADEPVRDFNAAAVQARQTGSGLGSVLASFVRQRVPADRAAFSVLAACARASATITVHVSIGCDVTHIHGTTDGEALGASSHRDFRSFCGVVASLSGGVYVNLGSAVVMPEVFLKGVSVSFNLGYPLDGLVTANMDMLTHYRPSENVLRRIPGTGIDIRGRHEITLPALHACIVGCLARNT